MLYFSQFFTSLSYRFMQNLCASFVHRVLEMFKGGLCSPPMMHCTKIYYRIGLRHHHFEDGCIEQTTPSSSHLQGRYRHDLIALLRFEYHVRLYSTFSAIFTPDVVFGHFIFVSSLVERH